MKDREPLQDLSLPGGPLHRLGCRLGLVRGGTNTVPLGLVLGAFPWIVLLVDAALFLVPMYVFSRKLWSCKVKGLSDYSVLAERYVNEFDRTWLRADPAQGEPLLGSADIQSLADLSNSVGIVRDMRLVPVSPSILMYLAAAALLPLLPLVLFKYPLADLLAKFFGRLSGL